MDAAAPLDPAQSAKTRARRRLIGAIALALAAVVFVPMLFDRTQVPPTNDIAVQIPDRDTPFEGRRGVPDPSKGPLRPSSSLPAPSSSSSPSSTTTDASPGAPTSAPTDVAPPPAASVDASRPAMSTDTAGDKAVEKMPDKSAGKPVPKAAEKVSEKNAEKANEKANEKGNASSSATQGDDPRALAALEGKPVGHASSESASGKGFAVQIAAFSAADKARNMRDQLNANGLKAYTEPLSTPQGLRTRVRLGPFPSREAAERARQKLRTMKLDGSVVTL